jgi:hypothetical protein
VLEVYLLRHNIGLESIKSMTENEVLEYSNILGVLDEIESEKMKNV